MIDLINSHRSIRKFKDTPISDEQLKELLKAGQSASTSHNMQAYHVIQVKNVDIREKIAHLAGPQKYIAECPIFLIFCANLRKIYLSSNKHQKNFKTNMESFLASSIDCALFAENVLLAAESLHYGGVFIGGIRNDIKQVIQLLNIPTFVFPLFGMCIGVPANQPDQKPRFDIDSIYSIDEYPDDKDTMEHIAEYDQRISKYYLERNLSQKKSDWSTELSKYFETLIRQDVMDLIIQQGFIESFNN